MIRLALRQFRTQAAVAIALLVVVAALLGSTGPRIARLYKGFAQAQAACVASAHCRDVTVDIGQFDSLLKLIATALVGLPALIGAFWGAPMISRELENGTHRLVWTQSVSRRRWIGVKLAVVGTAALLATGLLSLMVTWWSSPMDRADMNRFGVGLFGERNIAPIGYAAFGFVIGVAAGILIRRTVPAMAATLAVFLGVRLTFAYVLRQHLMTPKHLTASLSAVTQGFGSSNGGPPSLFVGAPNLPNAWVYSTRIVDSSGHGLTTQVFDAACPDLVNFSGGPPAGGVGSAPVPSADGKDALQTCVSKLGATYHGLVTYQPANRYWLFQTYETAIFLVAAALLGWFCVYWLSRRTS